MNTTSKIRVRKQDGNYPPVMEAENHTGQWEAFATVLQPVKAWEQMAHNVVSNWNATRFQPAMFFSIPKSTCEILKEGSTCGSEVSRLPFPVCGYEYIAEVWGGDETYRNCQLGLIQDGKFVCFLHTNQPDPNESYFTFNSTWLSQEDRNT